MMDSHPQGIWSVFRHKAPEVDNTVFGISFRYFNSVTEVHEQITGVLKDKLVIDMDVTWSEPNLEEIRKQTEPPTSLSLMVFDAEELRAEAQCEGFSVNNIPEKKVIIARRIDPQAKIDFILTDLENYEFNVKLKEESGILFVESEKKVKYKYWDDETLIALRQQKDSAFDWWEFE